MTGKRENMGFFGGVFWGVVLIVVGLLIVLRYTIGIELPVFRILFGLLVIYAGLRILLGPYMPFHRGVARPGHSVFMSQNYSMNDSVTEHNTIFGESVIRIPGDVDRLKKREINTIFGSTRLEIPSNMPVEIRCDAAFAGAYFPDETMISFGQYVYRQGGKGDLLLIKTAAIFGRLEVVKR